MPQIAPLRPGDPTRLGTFVLSGRIGEGGQGVVYLGAAETGERAAVKLLHVKFSGDATARSRFARELRAAQRVASFCTARVLAADLEGDTPYIASEYIEGQSLRETVESSGPLSGASLERLAVGTATALTAIHQAGIVHRDFKPDNVLIAVDGPRVVDFGIARIVDSTATITSRAIGTPAYMAPEQISGAPVGPPADVFAWASTIAYAATGRAVFGGDSIAAVLNRILNHDIDTGMLPEPLAGVVRSCLSKAPDARPAADQILLRLLGRPGSDDASTVLLSEGAAHAAAAPVRGGQGRSTESGAELAGSHGPTGPTGPAGPAGGGSGQPGSGEPGPAGAPERRPAGERSRGRRWIGGAMAGLVVAAGGVFAVVKFGPPSDAAGSGPGVTRPASVATSGPSSSPSRTFRSVADRAARTGRLTIGVKGDLPGVSLPAGDGFKGFDVDVATYLAKSLKVPPSGITFRRVGIGDRVRSLSDGVVDMVVAAYPYDDNKKDPVTFAGPYYTAHTDLLVVKNSPIRSLKDLANRRMCAPRGNKAVRLIQDAVNVQPVPAGDYARCVQMLVAGEVEAVPGDDLMLAGFAARETLRMSVLGLRLADQRYAVGLPEGDVTTCRAVSRAIARMYKDGTMKDLLKEHFGDVDFHPEDHAPPALACR
ncbi:serine/threonine-protein kinase [Microbispora sp. NPDC049125]|uniref:serine/threonine-protein kinase n=1 Tax=Microbispora sp. NPDC049125 TaxID=3154929 RepID=UPI00346743FB